MWQWHGGELSSTLGGGVFYLFLWCFCGRGLDIVSQVEMLGVCESDYCVGEIIMWVGGIRHRFTD